MCVLAQNENNFHTVVLDRRGAVRVLVHRDDIIEMELKEVACVAVWTVLSWIQTDSQELTEQRLDMQKFMYTIFNS